MTMTDEEICREYREAKTPMKQIGILADENQCRRERIVEILRAAGMELPAVYREKNAGAVHQPSPAGDTLTQGKAETENGGAEYGPILPAPKMAAFEEWVNDGAIEVIARLMADSDSSMDQQEASWAFRERVRGVLALVHELRGGNGE